jgi:succinoglycan biosynthesis protein ExoL
LVKLAFFGHDACDPAVQRRISAFMHAGVETTAFTMRRGALSNPAWRNVDLGETRDAAFAQRLLALARARPILARNGEAIAASDVLYARNLDMLALADWSKRMAKAHGVLIYECLDVHRFMTRRDLLGNVLRGVESNLLKRTDMIAVSSPAFVSAYFDRHQPDHPPTVLVENRLPWGFEYGPRPAPQPPRDGPLRIGWFGNLRCRRSLNLLLKASETLRDRLTVLLWGAPARHELPDFEQRIDGRPNVEFRGRYRWPEDLELIYGNVDLVWAGDFHDPSANSKWLLPNRLYEGGYFGTPPIAPADSETGRWIERHGFGFTLEEPLEETFPKLLEGLTSGDLNQARQMLAAAPDSVFLQPQDELRNVIEAALQMRQHA